MAGNSESRFLFAEDASQVAKIAEVRDRLPHLEAVIVLDGEADGDAITLDELRERGRGRDAAEVAERAAAVKPRRPVHVHLHLRHDRAAEGLRALARQLPLGRDDVRGGEHPPRGRPRLPLPAARALVRAADRADRDRPRRHDRLLGRRSEGHRRRADGGQAALPAVGPADLREDLHARHLERRPGEDPRRHAARAQGPRAPGGRASRSRTSSRRCSTRPTRSCSPTSATCSAAGCARPPAARRRSRRRSSSSSTPAACRCSRATA